jgi:exodeoxyribonuclease VII small subunit
MAELKFEDALRKLEAMVGNLESGELNLDEAIKKYEEGMSLSNYCYKKLHEIQKKVEVLVKDSSGKLTAKEFDAAVIPEKAEIRDEDKKSPTKKKRSKGEELLF